MLRPILMACICAVWAQSAIAQTSEVWDLQRCIDHAWQHSLRIQQNQLSIEQSQLAVRQADYARYPSANANVQHGFNSGRSIDLTSYQFVNQFMQSTALSLSISVPIYNGLQLRHSHQRTQTDLQASQKDMEQTRNDLALAVSQAYLSALLAEESLEVLKKQIAVTQAQYDRTKKLIDAGTLPENNRFDLEAQIARDEQNIVNAENSLQLAYLNLKIAMNADPNAPIQVQKVELSVPANVEEATPEQVFQEASANQPNLTAARLREKSAELNVRIAEGALQPTISAYGNLATNYASTGQRFTGDSATVTQTLSGDLNGVPFQLSIPQSVPVRERSPYFYQLGNNFRQSFGINVQIPIFNAFQLRNNVARAELSVKTAKLSTMQVQTQLKSDIQQALANVRAAKKRLEAAERTLRATEAAVANTQKRYELGVVNGFEWTSVQNSLVSARSSLIQAKYDYVFRLKIVDFYRGRPIQLN